MQPGYGRLVELAERELELVRAGSLDELPNLWAARREVVCELPYVPPLEARDCLARAAELQGRTTALLEERVAATRAELRRGVARRPGRHGAAPAARGCRATRRRRSASRSWIAPASPKAPPLSADTRVDHHGWWPQRSPRR